MKFFLKVEGYLSKGDIEHRDVTYKNKLKRRRALKKNDTQIYDYASCVHWCNPLNLRAGAVGSPRWL